MNALLKLNRERKLGLRIVPTIRLLEVEGGKPRLVHTRLETSTGPPAGKFTEFMRDMFGQIKILQQNGYTAGIDSFLSQIDKKTGKCIAVIFDFGSVESLEDAKKLHHSPIDTGSFEKFLEIFGRAYANRNLNW